MAWLPDRRILLNIFTAAMLLSVACGGVFFVFAPYQASRIRADLSDRLHVRGEAPLVLATAEEGGAYHKLGGVLRQHLDAFHSYVLEVKTTQGSVENLGLLKDASADLALVQSGIAWDRDNLVALANLGRQYLHVVVPADSPIEAFRDLAGKRIGVGPKGSGAEDLAGRMLGFFNFGEETSLVYDHNPELKEAFLDGEIDAAFTVHGLFDPAMETLLSAGWYRLVPVREAESVSRYLPGVFAETLPPSLYGPDRSIPAASDAPFQTLAVNTLLVCQRSLPNRQVHTVLELIFRGDFLKAAHLTGLTEVEAQVDLHLPLHAGAEEFYNRRNPISADRFEMLSFILAGVVCLASVYHFLSNRHRVNAQAERRRAIRPYFEAMMDFGDEVEASGNPANLTRLVHKMMATQRGAEREWLEGAFDTEDMENLYAVYGLRCDNAFHKIFDLHLQALRGLNSVEPPRPGAMDDLPDYVKPVLPQPRPRSEEPFPEDSHPYSESRPYLASRTYTESRVKPRLETEDDSFFAGSALAGIDKTKSEIAERLPSRYDPGLLYDTEASGAGSVRVRKSKPQADLQAVVEKAVVEKDVPPRPATVEVPAPDFDFLSEDPFAEVPAPVEGEPEQDEESGPDQLMLF